MTIFIARAKQGRGKTRMKVLLFKTSVKYIHEVEEVREALNKLLQSDRWSFDLDDCDHVLRIVSDRVQPAHVV